MDCKSNAETVIATAADRRLHRILKGETAPAVVVDGDNEGNVSDAQRDAAQSWRQSNADLYFILDYACQGSAQTCVRRFKEDRDGRADGGAAWRALCTKFESTGGL